MAVFVHRLVLTAPCVCLLSVTFPSHTHLLFESTFYLQSTHCQLQHIVLDGISSSLCSNLLIIPDYDYYFMLVYIGDKKEFLTSKKLSAHVILCVYIL